MTSFPVSFPLRLGLKLTVVQVITAGILSETMSNAFKFNYAIVCRVPESFADRGTKDPGRQIDITEARRQHRQFVDSLKKCDVNIIELQEDEDYKDCCCVEDCAVIIGSTALITRPGQATRQGETREIRRVLRADLKLRIVEVQDSGATLDGGDVLFTGKEIFVGVGKNTNERGALAVVDAFPEYYVTPLDMEGTSCLHLKSVCSMAGKDVIAFSNSPCGSIMLKRLKEQAQYSYLILRLDSDSAANMVYLNSRLIHRTREEINETSFSTLDEKILYPRHQDAISELEKARVTLGSLVLLINKQRKPRKVVSNLSDNDMDKYSTIKTWK